MEGRARGEERRGREQRGGSTEKKWRGEDRGEERAYAVQSINQSICKL